MKQALHCLFRRTPLKAPAIYSINWFYSGVTMCLFQSLESLLITIPQWKCHPGNSAGVYKVYKIKKLIYTFVSKCLDYLWALRTSPSTPSFLYHAKFVCSFRSESSRAMNMHLMSTESLQHLQDLLSSTETPEPANFTLLDHHYSDRQL